MATATKTSKTKTAKANKADNKAASVIKAFNDSACIHNDRLQALLAVDVSAMNVDEYKAHKSATLAAKNRAQRCAAFAAAMEGEAFADTFVKYNLTAESVQRLQIYAQDKLMQTVAAIAADCALSAVRGGNHSNNMTQRLVAVLQKDGKTTVRDAPRRMHDMHPDKSMGTYNAQAGSSRQVLQLLGLVDYDALTRTFALNDAADNVLHVIAM